MADQPPFDYTGRCVLHGRLDCPPCEAAEAAIEPPSDSDEVLSWCARCGQPTRWDGHQWVRDPDDEQDER